MALTVCILAAGQGKRMHSDRPKVLHHIGGKSLVQHVLDTARSLSSTSPLVIYGHGGEQLQNAIDEDVIWVEQPEQLGTGHAVAQALPHIPDGGMTLVLYGDVPLLREKTLAQLISVAEQTGFGLLTVALDDPSGYGRIVRNEAGAVERIVEHKDADKAEFAISEVNTGIMAVSNAHLQRWIPALANNNAQQEYYLTDCVAAAVAEGIEVATVSAATEKEVTGVNNRVQLAN
ncbi:MAG: NTP transferase domain-containing protein, partial [Gammaproteobacteria bacterium]